jgi:tetratricopeptide (TPR) repeat protein
MVRRAFALVVVLSAALPAAAEGPAPAHERLLRDLSSETAAVREDARRRLERADGLTEDEVRAALRDSDARGQVQLLRLATARRMSGLLAEIAPLATSEDPRVADGAIRALVSLGDEAVAAGRKALADPAAAASRTHLEALAAQRSVERVVLAKWRRKGGQYEGRYSDLAKLGWPVQPILLAMLLDVPLEDRHVVLPETSEPAELLHMKREALQEVAASVRRGYKTFEPLPPQIEPDDLFDLAYQAMKDVADIDLVGDILESVSARLQEVDDMFGFRLRRWEQGFYKDIDEVLFARGRPERLRETEVKLRSRAAPFRHWIENGESMRVEELEAASYQISQHASVLHQMREYEKAANSFSLVIQIGRMLGGKDPAIDGYNRACSLAKLGRKDAAIAQLERALDRTISSGTEDLTSEWVLEDGDLASLHGDPRFKAIVRKHFGEDAVKAADAPK